MKHIIRSTAGALALALTAITGGSLVDSGSASAAENWRMHIVWVDARPEAQAYQRFADRVNERAAGSLQIRLFTGGSSGVQDTDMLRILQQGRALQIAGLYPGYMTRDEPEYAYVIPPGVVGEPQTLIDILPTLSDIYQTTYDKWGITLLGYVQHPVQKTHIFCTQPIRTLADLQGKKVRVWERFHAEVFDRLGIAAQVIGQNDLYVALQTGVVDCAVYPVGFAPSVSLHEVAPYAAYLFPYVLHPLNIIVANRAFEALDAATQQVLREVAAEIEAETTANYLSGEFDGVAAADLTARGLTILEPFPDADRERFSETAIAVWQEMTAAAGGKAAENFTAVSTAIAR